MVKKAMAVLLVVCFVLATVGAASAQRTTNANTVTRATNLAYQNNGVTTHVETLSVGGTNVALGDNLPSAGNTVTTSVSSCNSVTQLNT